MSTFLSQLRLAREAATIPLPDFDDFEHQLYDDPMYTGEHMQSCSGCREYQAAEEAWLALAEFAVNNAEKLERLIGQASLMHGASTTLLNGMELCTCGHPSCTLHGCLAALDGETE